MGEPGAQVRLTAESLAFVDEMRADSGRSRAQEVNYQLTERQLDLADAELLGRHDEDDARSTRRRSGRASVARPLGRHGRRRL